mmetsp:Transcript_5112/g.15590  ORF Transcript_5112/g.15590 Transcript_5112/m.15590 type:complete len:1405 (+) Transcript_5112:71-4285(+)
MATAFSPSLRPPGLNETSIKRRGSNASLSPPTDTATAAAAPTPDIHCPEEGDEGSFRRLLQTVVADFDLIRQMSEHADHRRAEALIRTSILLFSTKGKLLGLTAHAIRAELRRPSPAVPFGSATFNTRFISAVSFAYGRIYLKELLSPVIKSMLDCPGMSYEINPGLISSTENMGENRSALRSLVNGLIVRVIGSVGNLPEPLSLLWHIVAIETSKRSPDAVSDVVSKLLLCRFWGPAIACPKAYGICNEHLPSTVARGLVLASKVLQAMGAGKGFREDYMQCMAAFARNNKGRLTDYTAAACIAPPCVPKADVYALSTTQGSPRPWLRMMNGANPVDTEPLAEAITTADVVHFYALLHDCKSAVIESAGAASGTAVTAAFTRLGDPNKDGLLAEDVASAVVRELTTAKVDAVGENASVGNMYPDTDVIRTKVIHSSWDVMDQTYAPSIYTDTTIDGADPDIFEKTALLMFNDLDPAGIDRRSGEGNYKVVNGAPRNPIERTGISGRGKLRYWGPNHVGNPVITRWSRNVDGSVRKRFGRPVAEVLANSADDGTLRLLTAPLKPDCTVPDWVADFFSFSNDVSLQVAVRSQESLSSAIQFGTTSRAWNGAIDTLETREDSGAAVLTATVVEFCDDPQADRSLRSLSASPNGKKIDDTLIPLFTSGTRIYKGYIHDDLNTDNAWVESTSWHFHDKFDDLTDYGPAIDAYGQMRWVTMDEDSNWGSHAKDVLSDVADRLGAHFGDRLLPFLCEIIPLIENHGLEQQGIYRLSGSKKNITALSEAIYSSADLPSADLAKASDVNELTGLVKALLRDMTPPLIPFELYADAVALATADADAQTDLASELLLKLPTSNFKALSYLVQHLKKTAALALENRMGVSNLAVVFGPTIMRSPKGLSDDLRDQGSQCKFASVLMGMSLEFFDTLSTLRKPGSTLSLNFEVLDIKGDVNGSYAPSGPTTGEHARAPTPTRQPTSPNAAPVTDDGEAVSLRPARPSLSNDPDKPLTRPRRRSSLQLPANLDLSALKTLALEVSNAFTEDVDDYGESCTDDDTHEVSDGAFDDSKNLYANVRETVEGMRLVTSPEGFDTKLMTPERPSADDSLPMRDVCKAVQSQGASNDEFNDGTNAVAVTGDVSGNNTDEEYGDCADCWSAGVVGKYDTATDSFYCSRCWEVWAEDKQAPLAEASPIAAAAPAPITRATNHQKDAAKQLFDEDGLPIDDSPVHTRPSVLFDDDGLPCDINVDEYELDEIQEAVLHPPKPDSYRASLSAIEEEGGAAPRGRLSRHRSRPYKAGEKHDGLSFSIKAVKTAIDGVLFREVGTTWKKRYVTLNDNILEVHKSPKQSSLVSEVFNITACSRVGYELRSRTFQMSFPERGYTLRLKAKHLAEANEWIRILTNACRLAHSHA